MRYISLILLCSINGIVLSQSVTFKWADQIGSSAPDAGKSITTDILGNVITTGSFQGITDFDPGPGVFNLTPFGANDIFITKHDNIGNLVWAKQVGGLNFQNSYGLAADANGNIYITGHFSGTVDLDPGPLVYNFTSTFSGYAVFILKLNSNGDFVWAKKVGDSFYNSTGYTIAVDPIGNVYAAGLFQGTSDFDPGPAIFNLNSTAIAQEAFFLKLDNNGNFIWAKQFDGVNAEICYSMVVDANQNVYATGLFDRTCDFDPGPGIYNLSTDIPSATDVFVCRLNINGDFVWAKNMGGTLDAVAQSIAIDLSGNVLTTGRFQGIVDFDPGSGIFNLTSPLNYSTFVSKLDNNGNFIWAKILGLTPGGCEGFSIATDVSGDVYTTGFFSGTADFDPGVSIFNLQSAGYSDIFISKLTSTGNFIFSKQIGGAASDDGVSINVDALKNIYVTGYFFKQVDFDPGISVYNFTSKGSGDAFVLKLSQCTNSSSSLMSVKSCNSYTLNNETFTTSGTYTQTLVNVAGCDSVITLNLSIGGSSDTTSLTACNSYQWQAQIFSTSGNYKVKFIGDDGCDSLLVLNLVINNPPKTTLNQTICAGENYAGYTTSGIYTNTYTAANGCDSVQTLNLTVRPEIFSKTNVSICKGANFWGYSKSGIYSDTLTSFNGCDSIRILNIVVNPLKTTSIEASICEGSTYFAEGAFQNTSGIYKDTLFTTAGCDSIVTTNLLVHLKPVIDLGFDKNLCFGDTQVLDPGLFNSYEWQDQSTLPNFTVSKPGTYWVRVTDNNNCTASDTLLINNIFPLPSNFLKQTDNICQYEKLYIYTTKNFISYLWSTGSGQPNITVETAGKYYLTVKDINGCKGSDTINVIQKSCYFGLYIPTGFTPNGDQLNDIFKARVYGAVISFQLHVYNRFGKLVFTSTDPQKGWDGRVKGIAIDADVFVWLCSYHLQGAKPVSEKGVVTLIR